MAFTDDDGETWTPAQLNLPDGSNDHQTVGAGPYPPAFAGLANPQLNKNHAVYYCGQAGYVLAITGSAYCSRSDDGGLNFGKAVIAYTDSVSGCAQSIHGHVKVAPDGTVYLPNSSCDGHPAVAVSIDAGTTWTVKEVPTGISSPAILDPSVAIASDNTVYLFFIGKPSADSDDGHIYATVSRDHGDHWSTPFDIGAGVGVVNAVFPAGIAGDGDRAACAFLGTSTNGDHQAADFKGTWYGYVAHTYDGGATWVTVNATPNGPVQRQACVWNGGGANVCRNLLDFNDITMDENGLVLFGFADGCVGTCETGGPNSYSSKATIARQSGGKGLLHDFDPVPAEPLKPQAACLSGTRDDMASYLSWVVPDNGGSPITSYKIYRTNAAGGPEQLVGQPTNGKNSFVDRTTDPTVMTYNYRITAVNTQGEGGTSNVISLTVGPRAESLGACALPGVQVFPDPAGDEKTSVLAGLVVVNSGPQQDITSVSMSEPMTNPTVGTADNIVFTMKVASMRNNPTDTTASVPPGWRWAVRFGVSKNGVPQQPPTDFTGGAAEDYFVAMVTSDPVLPGGTSATPQFTWGVTSVPQNAARVFTTKGTLHASSNVTPDGTITLILPKSNIGNPAPLDSIIAMLGSVRLTGPSEAPNTGGTNETIADDTGGGSYQLRSLTLCLPNTAPIARLTADIDEGLSPLTVHFNGSTSSDPDSIDTIANYTFNFDDGAGDVTPNPANTPTITHTFTQPGEYNVRLVVTDSRGKISSNTAKFIVDVQQALGVAKVASRKVHGTAGTFDIDLPLTGDAGIECRAPGANNSYQLVYKFNKPVSVAGVATPTQGTATAGIATINSSDPTEVLVPLTGVTNQQHVLVSLSGVQGGINEVANNQVARLDVLVGDIDASRRVDSTDVFQVRQQSLKNANSANFRTDVDGSGRIDSTDVFMTRQNSLKGLP
jgi:PKD repeat protein